MAEQSVRQKNAKAVQESREGVWYLKEIIFNGKPVKIITQNYNGPCSFIAICNILILRGDITILPPERTSVSYEFLSQLVADYLLTASPDVDISAALSMMPLTQKGMDLNPLFTSPTAFRPAGDAGALKLFEQAGVQLVHGWLVDPDSPEYRVLAKTEDYDNSVNLIVAVDHLTKGQLVVDEGSHESSQAAPSSPAPPLSDEERKQVEDALVVQHFLETTSSQLTYHGLFVLHSTIQPGSLVALFRNSHLSVLYRPPEDTGLYQLVTDAVFYNEPTVVWEKFDDVDGNASSFVDHEFKPSSPAGGDFAGHTAESALAAIEEERARNAQFDPADRELARQLQAEEDAHAQQLYAERERQREQRLQQQQAAAKRQHQQTPSRWLPNRQPRQNPQVTDPQIQQLEESIQNFGLTGSRPPKTKTKDSCIVM